MRDYHWQWTWLISGATNKLKDEVWLQLSESLYQRQIWRLTKFAEERERASCSTTFALFLFHIFTRALWGKQQIEVFWDNFNQFLLGKLSNSCWLKPHHPWKSICSTRNPPCTYGEDNSNSQHMLDLKEKNMSYL